MKKVKKEVKKTMVLNGGEKGKQASLFYFKGEETKEIKTPSFQNYTKGRPFTIKFL